MYAFTSYFVVIICVMVSKLAGVEIDKNDEFNLEENFFNHILEEHNEYRKIHDSRLLVIHNFCTRRAKDPLKEMMGHRFSTDYLTVCGVNKFSMDFNETSKLNAMLAKKIVKSWYETGANYNYLAEPTNNEADPFTQVVWNDSSHLGLQMQITRAGKLYVAATYFVKGNIKGTYMNNVNEPKKPSVKKIFDNLLKGLKLKNK